MTDVHQLALCLWTTKGSWPASTEHLRKELCTNGAASFTSVQIAEDATKCVEDFQRMHLGENRPAKRRKTQHKPSGDANISAYHELMILLNGSSQESPVLNLSNLHNVVQYVSLTFIQRRY